MIASLIITFRETLEAALVTGIVLSYLSRTRQTRYNGVVYAGVASGAVAAVLGALAFSRLAGGFTGRAEQLFEGITMLLGALLLSTMILWMMRQTHLAQELETRVAAQVADAHRWGLFSLVFVAVLREGIETVIFLGAVSATAAGGGLVGALIGIVAAIALGYVSFVGARKVNIKTFFNLTSLLLIVFAAGLVGQGVHELQEAGLTPPPIEHVWDINPPLNPDGSYPPLHENGYIGSVLKSLLGYNGNPSLIEVLGYVAYLAVMAGSWRNLSRASKGMKRPA
jgi:high-affinity iron transporter